MSIIDKLPWDRFDELSFLLVGYIVGFGLIACGQPESGTKVIDTITGAILMYLKGKN